jgi:hypothetical protein
MSKKTATDAKSQSQQEAAKDGNPKSVNLSGLPDPIYLDKDTKKQYPLQKHDLDNVIVYQFTKQKIREHEYDVPADHVSAIGVYTPEEYEAHTAEDGLFERLGLSHEVWHTPEEKAPEGEPEA